MPTPLKLGSIQGYALVGTASAMRVGAIQGYALVRTPNLPNVTVSGPTALLAAMNKQYKSSFTATQVTFGPPQALANDPDYNTTTELTAIRTSGYSGSKIMRYNRVEFSLVTAGKDTAIPTTGMGSTIVASLAALNTKLGLALVASDVVDAPIPSGATGFNIVIASTSVLFIPGSMVRMGTPIPTMAQAFPQVELFAF